ncbi:ribose-phosphate pyrophosphokinase [Candidatus Woesearchaeota archaeon]|nr:MAG: ribose-phosphate pyrophosphokinase [Candidatus Woesearchaeota archaeon]
MVNKIRLFTGNSNPELAQEVADCLTVPLTKAKVQKFIDGETYVKILEPVRGDDVFVIQPTSHPANEHIMELLIMLDALRRASPKRITAVIPFYGYARQDRKATSREPITARLVADLLTAVGTDRVLAVDLHADQIQGFFNIPLDHLTAVPIILNYYFTQDLKNTVVVAPDEGSVKSNSSLARKLGLPLVIIHKSRSKTAVDSFDDFTVLGSVKGKNVIILDDEINTAGTISNAVKMLKDKGAKRISIAATHAVFAGPAVERLRKAPVDEVIVTNTIRIPPEKKFPKLKVLSMAPMIAEAIRRIHEERSMGTIFDEMTNRELGLKVNKKLDLFYV